MIPKLLVHPDLETRRIEANKCLILAGFKRPHPDLLWFDDEEKLGVESARKIKEFLSLKPYQGDCQAIVIVTAQNLTSEAQNALLKTLEEPLGDTLFILGVISEDQLLPTITSRCQVINLRQNQTPVKFSDHDRQQIESLLKMDQEQKFRFVEKLAEREQLLYSLTSYFREKLITGNHSEIAVIVKDLIEAEKWEKQHVNIRAILEYLMLKLPQMEKS